MLKVSPGIHLGAQEAAAVVSIKEAVNKSNIKSIIKTVGVPFHGLNLWANVQAAAWRSKGDALLQKAAHWAGVTGLAGAAAQLGAAAIIAAKVFGIALPIVGALSGVGLPIAIATIAVLGIITAYSTHKTKEGLMWSKSVLPQPPLLDRMLNKMDNSIKQFRKENVSIEDEPVSMADADGPDTEDVHEDVDVGPVEFEEAFDTGNRWGEE